MSNVIYKTQDRYALIGKVLASFGLIVMLIFLSLLIVIAPQFVLRLIPFFMIMTVIVIAGLMRTDRPVSDVLTKFWIVVLLSVMAMWPTYMILKFGSLPTVDGRKIIAGLSFCLMIFFLISRKNLTLRLWGKENLNFRIGLLLLFGYAFLRTASCFVSPQPLLALIEILWEILYYYSFFIVGAFFFSRDSTTSFVMNTFMLIAVMIGVYATIEWVTHQNILMKFVPNGREFTEFQRVLTSSRLRDGFFRAQGTFEHPLLLGEFAAMALSFGISTLLWPTKSTVIRFLAWTTTIFSLAGAFFSGSRSAAISVIAAIFVVVLLRSVWPSRGLLGKSAHSMRKIIFLLSVVGVLSVFLPIASLIVKGKTTGEVTSTQARVVMMNQGLPSIEKHPILGTGPGTAGSIAGIIGASGVRTLDNYFLALAIDSGVPALVLLLALLLYPIWLVLDRVTAGVSVNISFQVAAAGALVVTTLIHSILWMPYNFSFAFLFSGMIFSQSMKKYSNVGKSISDEHKKKLV